MLSTRWEPFANLWSEMDRFRRELDRVFDAWDSGLARQPAFSVAYPPVNVWQDADNVYAEAELPGLQLNDLEIYVTGGDQLLIQGERKPLADPKGTWHRRERGFGRFSRTVSLPVPVEADNVQARFENGVLQVTLPKSEKARPRRITVKAS